ncbi:NlpC/P60 family protein [Polyangium sorediatum]|uniref:NlpC/P60 domain-containing protein n=1 Tax=Polyangium sorediatum TaxID=889274 RepID=A0ABT6NNJ6_9BACT|nr:NlpC/P60 family protein [Polyangium sorediatum]MDI1429856.1 hypothetical protein [Polyangium sorediatum]
MATILAAFRSFAGALLPSLAIAATLTGCLGGGGGADAGDEDTEITSGDEGEETGGDETTTPPGDEPVVEVGGEEQSAGPCGKVATFSFARSGETKIASIGGEPVAWFTHGGYSVRMAGPSRTFGANKAASSVTTTTWVRTLSEPFDAEKTSEETLSAWLNAARGVNCEAGTQDVIAISYDYAEGGSKDARYALGADFHDFLGIDWDPIDAKSILADLGLEGALDCSGYMRLVWGSRANFTYDGADASLPLSLKSVPGHLPRTSEDMYRSGPGRIVVPFRTQPAGAAPFQGAPTTTELAAIEPGDLVFFDSQCNYTIATALLCGKDVGAISHVGMFVGRDNGGNYRFISSRSQANGPTVGNTGGWSIFNAGVDGTGSYPQRFRGARRL